MALNKKKVLKCNAYEGWENVFRKGSIEILGEDNISMFLFEAGKRMLKNYGYIFMYPDKPLRFSGMGKALPPEVEDYDIPVLRLKPKCPDGTEYKKGKVRKYYGV